MLRTREKVAFLLILPIVAVFSRPAGAQELSVSGRVTDGRSGAAVQGATLVLEGFEFDFTLRSTTDADGMYSLPAVPSGSFELAVLAVGYLPSRTDLTVLRESINLDVQLMADVHFTPVMAVNPATDPIVSFTSAHALGDEALARELQSTIAATVQNMPGVAQRSFGPGPARPVLRGLDGDRVLILQDGLRLGDLSSQSGDHGVPLSPTDASRIEIVRGPATLLYGANPIGGLVNVVMNDIPVKPVTTPTGSFLLDASTGAPGGGAAGNVTAGRGNVAFHASGGGRRLTDVKTPDGRIPNSFVRSGSAQVGVGFVSENDFLGASYGYSQTPYGIPFIGGGGIELDPRLQRFTVRGSSRQLSGPFHAVRGSLAVRRYRHHEVDRGTTIASLTNNVTELEALGQHRAAGRMNGSIGLSYLSRRFSTTGTDVLSPEVSQKGFAGYLYEEIAVADGVQFQVGGRLDRQAFRLAQDAGARDFTSLSGSIGLSLLPSDNTFLTVSGAGGSRIPALEELFFRGRHAGTGTVERGDPNLKIEEAFGFDLTAGWRSAVVSGELSVFVNQIDNFIFRRFLFPRPTNAVDNDLAEMVFSQADARMHGVESHVDVRVGSVWLEAGLDYVRGELVESDTPMPRVPPLRGRGAIQIQRNGFAGGVQGIFAGKQDRVFTMTVDSVTLSETPSDRYAYVNVFGSYAFVRGITTSTVTVRLDNASNVRYHNHLNYLRGLAPEMGRNFVVVYGVRF